MRAAPTLPRLDAQRARPGATFRLFDPYTYDPHLRRRGYSVLQSSCSQIGTAVLSDRVVIPILHSTETSPGHNARLLCRVAQSASSASSRDTRQGLSLAHAHDPSLARPWRSFPSPQTTSDSHAAHPPEDPGQVTKGFRTHESCRSGLVYFAPVVAPPPLPPSWAI